MNRERLLKQIEMHEGFRGKPYKDSEGIMTIGIGRNVEANPLSHEEAVFMLENDVDKAIYSVNNYQWFDGLSDVRQRVVIDMAFNLGISGFSRFKKMITHIEAGRFRLAASEMLNSKWAWQVGARAIRLSKMMETDMDDTYFME